MRGHVLNWFLIIIMGSLELSCGSYEANHRSESDASDSNGLSLGATATGPVTTTTTATGPATTTVATGPVITTTTTVAVAPATATAPAAPLPIAPPPGAAAGPQPCPGKPQSQVTEKAGLGPNAFFQHSTAVSGWNQQWQIDTLSATITTTGGQAAQGTNFLITERFTCEPTGWVINSIKADGNDTKISTNGLEFDSSSFAWEITFELGNPVKKIGRASSTSDDRTLGLENSINVHWTRLKEWNGPLDEPIRTVSEYRLERTQSNGFVTSREGSRQEDDLTFGAFVNGVWPKISEWHRTDTRDERFAPNGTRVYEHVLLMVDAWLDDVKIETIVNSDDLGHMLDNAFSWRRDNGVVNTFKRKTEHYADGGPKSLVVSSTFTGVTNVAVYWNEYGQGTPVTFPGELLGPWIAYGNAQAAETSLGSPSPDYPPLAMLPQ